MKDKEISEEELLDELDTMYQRVADIEKEEEAAQQPSPPPKIKPKQKKKPPYRTIIIMASVFFVVLASIFAITIFDPMALLERLKTGGTRPSTLPTLPAPKKRSPVAPSPAPPKPPAVVTSQEPSKPSATATSSAPQPSPSVAPSPTVSPKLPSESSPVQTKQEVKRTQEEAEKPTSKPQEIVKRNKPALPGKYYAIQVGAFRDMENVRELVEGFKKEGLEAYWITPKGKGSLYRVLVGQFTDENEAAAFLRDKKIFDKYPGSFVKEISPSKINR